MTRVLLVGSGAREHAMALALRRSPSAELYVWAKHRNPGLVAAAKELQTGSDTDVQGILAWAKAKRVELVVVGPEAPLEAGLTDALRAAGIPCASPSKGAARIETDKSWMRSLMLRHNVPGRLAHHPFDELDSALAFLDKHGPKWAIKPLGLTGGKGVQVYGDHFHDVAGAKVYTGSVFESGAGGGKLQFEELALGEEFTVMAFTDGIHLVPMPAVQDHKRLHDGDEGPNTGGMGSYSQADGLLPFLTLEDYQEAVLILQALVDALRADGSPYVGAIYGQFMLTASGPKVIEVNARFGDPEAMNVLHLLSSDYLAILQAMATGTLAPRLVQFRPRATVVKYVVPTGYGDGKPQEQAVAMDLPAIEAAGGHVFLGAVEHRSGSLVTLPSRAIAVLGEAGTVPDAERIAEACVGRIKGPALHHRRDIGTPALLERRAKHMAALRGA